MRILTLVSTGPWRMGEGRDLWGFRSDTLLHPESLPWVSQGQEHSLAFFPTGLGQQAAQYFWPKGHHGLSPLGKSGTVCCGRLKSLDLSEVTSLNRHQPLPCELLEGGSSASV